MPSPRPTDSGDPGGRVPVHDAISPTRLARELRTADAVVIGLGSMIGAGIFAALAPAAGAAGAGLLDGVQQGLAIFQAGHASSPWWKIAWSFFDSTSKAAVSASALSFRRSSRSSSLMRRCSCFAATLSPAGSPRPPIASRFQASSAVGNKVFAAPGASLRLVQTGGGDHRFEPGRRGPAPRLVLCRVGQDLSAPAFQRRDADPDLGRDLPHRRTLWRQQARHHALFELLTVSSHVGLPSPPAVQILSARQLL